MFFANSIFFLAIMIIKLAITGLNTKCGMNEM